MDIKDRIANTIAVALLGFTLSVLSACGGGGDSGGSSSSTSSSSSASPPSASADVARTPPGKAVIVNVLSNDSDPSGNPLHPAVVTQPSGGSVTVNSDDTLTFTPTAGFAGITSFSYKAIDSVGLESAPTTVQVEVKPLQKVVYLTATGADQRVVFDDTTQVRVLSSPVGSSQITELRTSQNGKTALYLLQSASGNKAWYASDLQSSQVSASATSIAQDYYNSYLLDVSSDGLSAIGSVQAMSGFYASSELRLYGIFNGQQSKVNPGTPDMEQVSSAWFTNNDRSIVYISHAPANWSKNSTLFLAAKDSPGIATQLSATPNDGDSIYSTVRSTSDGSQVVYMTNRGNSVGVYCVNVASPGNEIALGPLGNYMLGTGGMIIVGFDIANQGHYGAYTMEGNPWWQGPAAAYLVSLDSLGSYTPIGQGFVSGTQLSAPLFSPNGQRIAIKATTSAGVTIYETTVTHPDILTALTPTYPTTSSIAAFQYTPDSNAIVFTVDAQQTSVFDIYAVQVSNPGLASRLNTPVSNASVLAGYFGISPDGTTVAYAQPEQAAGPLALFLVDLTTPGSPLKVGNNIAPLNFGPVPFAVVR